MLWLHSKTLAQTKLISELCLSSQWPIWYSPISDSLGSSRIAVRGRSRSLGQDLFTISFKEQKAFWPWLAFNLPLAAQSASGPTHCVVPRNTCNHTSPKDVFFPLWFEPSHTPRISSNFILSLKNCGYWDPPSPLLRIFNHHPWGGCGQFLALYI